MIAICGYVMAIPMTENNIDYKANSTRPYSSKEFQEQNALFLANCITTDVHQNIACRREAIKKMRALAAETKLIQLQ
jgi:uncharacterized protein YbaA (DUF1428 family)